MAAVIDETILRRFPASARAGPIAAQVARTLETHDPRVWAVTWDAMAALNLWSRLLNLPNPVLVLGGSADAGVPTEVTEKLAAALPRTSTQIVEGAGHLAAVEMPDLFAGMITDFLARSNQWHGNHRQP